jgi:hypothetical protein
MLGDHKPEIMNVVQNFHSLLSGNFNWLNSSNVALTPKNDGVGQDARFLAN